MKRTIFTILQHVLLFFVVFALSLQISYPEITILSPNADHFIHIYHINHRYLPFQLLNLFTLFLVVSLLLTPPEKPILKPVIISYFIIFFEFFWLTILPYLDASDSSLVILLHITLSTLTFIIICGAVTFWFFYTLNLTFSHLLILSFLISPAIFFLLMLIIQQLSVLESLSSFFNLYLHSFFATLFSLFYLSAIRYLIIKKHGK